MLYHLAPTVLKSLLRQVKIYPKYHTLPHVKIYL